MSMPATLLATKLQIPRQRPDMVARTRLVQRLDEGLWDVTNPQQLLFARKATLVCAPAGFGKTVALVQWLDQQTAQPGLTGPIVAWLSLDADDNDPRRFLVYLVAAIACAERDLAGPALDLLSAPNPLEAKTVLTVLINSLAMSAKPVLILLDDYHLIENSDVLAATTFLIGNLPDQAHIVLASRSDPPLPISRWRAQGQLGEVRASALRFTSAEAKAFLNQTMALDLSDDDIRLLGSRTEGWITGLQLVALSLRTHPPQARSRLVSELSGNHRHIIDYIGEEVMKSQSVELHDFMCQTSVLSRLSAPLCDAVTLRDDSDAMLRQMEHANLFIVALDEERRWYRYDGLFADFLRNRLAQKDPELSTVLLARAANWHVAHGDTYDAIDCLLTGGDYERAADAITVVAESVLKQSHISTLVRWIAQLPDDSVDKRPRLRMYYAWALLIDGFPLNVIQEQLDPLDDQPTAVYDHAGPIRALMSVYRGDIEQGLALNTRLLAELDESDTFLRCILLWNRGMFYTISGDVDEAVAMLDEAICLAESSGNQLIGVASMCHLAEMARAKGRLRQAYEIYQQALDQSRDATGAYLPIAGMALMGLGEMEREWERVDEALAHLDEGLSLTARWGKINQLDGWVSKALLYASHGNVAASMSELDRAEELSQSFDASDWDDMLVACTRAMAKLVLGETDWVAKWVVERGLDQIDPDRPSDPLHDDRPGFPGLKVAEFLLYARYLYTIGRLDESLKLTLRALDTTSFPGEERMTLYSQCLRAVTLWRMERWTQACQIMETELRRVMDEGWVRFIVDFGPDMGQILLAMRRTLEIEDSLRPYVDRLLVVCARDQQRRDEAETEGTIAEAPCIRLLEPLTGRELQVLAMVAEGLSNRAIAERIVVALSTVKSHINHIYGKLGVSRRTEAVARARELGILA